MLTTDYLAAYRELMEQDSPQAGRRPSETFTAALLALANLRRASVTEIARAAGVEPGNTSVLLRRFRRLALADVELTDKRNAGGRIQPHRFYSLTEDGRALAALARDHRSITES